MASHLYLVLLAAVVALSNGLECYDHLNITCEEDSEGDDSVCGGWKKKAYGLANATLKCPEKMNICATGEIQYNKAAPKLSVIVSFVSCGKGESKCFKDLKADDNKKMVTNVSKVLDAALNANLTVTKGKTEICFCDKDLCNSALSIVAHASVVVISLVLIIML